MISTKTDGVVSGLDLDQSINNVGGLGTPIDIVAQEYEHDLVSTVRTLICVDPVKQLIK